jgi:hypothetical protein
MEPHMTTAPRAFRRAVADKKSTARPVIEFTLESTDEKGEVARSDSFHAKRPTDERLFLLAAMAGDEDAGGAEEAAVTLDLLRDILPEPEFKILKARLLDDQDDVDMDMLQDVLMWLVEEWASFPTEPSSDSSVSQDASGTKSTGRVRGPGSTRSTTTSPAS